MRRLVIISGAGISAESGIRTFRTDTASGKAMWDEYDIEEVCNIHTFNGNFYAKTHDFYNKRREELSTVDPNLAHVRIAEWYNRFPNQVLNITTNVDDLFERAGIKHEDILHVHGYLPEVLIHERDVMTKHPEARKQTFYGSYAGIIDIGYSAIAVDDYHLCKPYVTFFGEVSDKYQAMYNMLDNLTNEDLVILVGCSNKVINFYWELFPVVNMGTQLIVINPQLGADVYQLEKAKIPYFQTGAVDAFSSPELIDLVENHLEGKTCLQKK